MSDWARNCQLLLVGISLGLIIHSRVFRFANPKLSSEELSIVSIYCVVSDVLQMALFNFLTRWGLRSVWIIADWIILLSVARFQHSLISLTKHCSKVERKRIFFVSSTFIVVLVGSLVLHSHHIISYEVLQLLGSMLKLVLSLAVIYLCAVKRPHSIHFEEEDSTTTNKKSPSIKIPISPTITSNVPESLNLGLNEDSIRQETRRTLLRYLFHEIRVPLNSISMGIDLLACRTTQVNTEIGVYYGGSGSGSGNMESYTPDEVEAIESIQESVQFLSDTLNDVMAMQQIEEGNMQLIHKQFSITQLFYNLTDSFSTLLTEQKVTLEWDIATNVPTAVVGDKIRIRHVLAHILSNAIKFSSVQQDDIDPAQQSCLSRVVLLTATVVSSNCKNNSDNCNNSNGSIGADNFVYVTPKTTPTNASLDDNKAAHTVSFSDASHNALQLAVPINSSDSVEPVQSEVPDTCFIKFTISDNGCGISEEQQKSGIFTPFQSLKTGDCNSKRGRGLGLPICREIVLMHGGTISYTSEVNKGSVFTVVVPFTVPQSPRHDDHTISPYLSRANSTSQSTLHHTTPGTAGTGPRLKRSLSHYSFSPYPSAANNRSEPIDTHLNVLSLVPSVSVSDNNLQNSVGDSVFGEDVDAKSLDSIDNSAISNSNNSDILLIGRANCNNNRNNSRTNSRTNSRVSSPLPFPLVSASLHSPSNYRSGGNPDDCNTKFMAIDTAKLRSSSSSLLKSLTKGTADDLMSSRFSCGISSCAPNIVESSETVRAESDVANTTTDPTPPLLLLPVAQRPFPETAATTVSVSVSDFNTKQPADVVGVPGAATGTGLPFRVLIADDVASNRKLLSMLLKKKGVSHIDFAENGLEAVDKVKESLLGVVEINLDSRSAERVAGVPGIGTSFDIIFMDNTMPVMTGVDATAAIRSLGYPNAIIGVTGNSLPAELHLFVAAGADLALTKPVKSEVLGALLEYFMTHGVHSIGGKLKIGVNNAVNRE